MPIYEYKCGECGKVFEVLQKKFDVDEAACEACGATGRRIMSNTSFVLKGTGWYVTDYKGNGSCPASTGGNGKSAASSDAGSSSGDTASTPCAKAASDGGCGSCKSAAAAAPAAGS
jgi:putative FmdB family regulatory protein